MYRPVREMSLALIINLLLFQPALSGNEILSLLHRFADSPILRSGIHGASYEVASMKDPADNIIRESHAGT